jgi:TonB family protein
MYNDKILKNMKRINTFVMLLILSIMEVCAQSMVGTWYSIGEDDGQQVFVFKSNGTFSYKAVASAKMGQYGTYNASESYTGKYVKDGKSLALTFDKSSFSSTINITLSDQVKSQLALYPSKKAKIDAALNQDKSELKQKMALEFEKLAAIGLPSQISLLNDRYLEFTWGKDFITFSKKGHNDKSPYDFETELKSILPEEEKVDDTVYEQVDQKPEYPGGMAECKKFISATIKYPNISLENGVQGAVIVEFVVNRDGSISDATVVRSRDPYLDKEALRVVSKMPKWKPGQKDGKAVRAKSTVVVPFKLNN